MLPLLHAFPLSLVREWRHPGQCAIIVITSFTPPPHHHHPQILEPATCHFSALLELRVCRLSGAKQCDKSCVLICFAWFCLLFPPRKFLPPPSSLDKLTFILAYFPPWVWSCQTWKPAKKAISTRAASLQRCNMMLLEVIYTGSRCWKLFLICSSLAFHTRAHWSLR